jgi:hypothetical protein
MCRGTHELSFAAGRGDVTLLGSEVAELLAGGNPDAAFALLLNPEAIDLNKRAMR